MVALRMIAANGVELNVAIEGSGPALVLLHGFPHTWQIWEPIIPALAESRTVIAPDLRGLGGSSRPATGYTVNDVASDVVALLDALNIEQTDMIGIDLGTPAAFIVGMMYPQRVHRLVLMEGLLGSLPGAEQFLKNGPPWWFGFHTVPGLAENVLLGNESSYIDFFLGIGTLGEGVSPSFREAALGAYSGRDALRAAFEHYRAFAESSKQLAAATANRRLTTPTLAIGSSPVGNTTYRQLQPIADTVSSVVLDRCGHIIPQHRPEMLLTTLKEFLT